MLILFFFLYIALIAIYVITPKNTTHLWLSVILVPLSMVILYTFFYTVTMGITNSTNISSAYIAGGAMVKTLVPAIIVGFVIYYQLKKKIKNEDKVKFPTYLVIIMGVILLIGIIMAVVEYQTESKIRNYTESKIRNYFENHSSERTWSNTEVNTLAYIKTLNYNGLTFSYYDDWKIEQNVIQDNLAFQVNSEKTGTSSDFISIVWLRSTDLGTTSEMVENTILEMKEEMSKYNARINSGDIYSIDFKGVKASVVDYNLTLFNEKTYGICFSFIMNGNTVIITKQSDSKEKLDKEFKIIENSFNIEIPE